MTDNGAGIVASVQCLNVVGNQAVLIAAGGGAFITLIFVEDNDGASQDRFGLALSSCDLQLRALIPAPVATGPLSFGPASIQSGDVLIRDAPALPTTREQCKKGGWRSFAGFRNQGDCVSFVSTGGGNRPPGS